MEYLRSRLFPRKPLKPLTLAGLLTCFRSSAFPLKNSGYWYLNRCVKLTAAGLFRISTWFPFNPYWRNQNLDKCMKNFFSLVRKNIFFGKLSCLIFSKSFPKRKFLIQDRAASSVFKLDTKTFTDMASRMMPKNFRRM